MTGTMHIDAVIRWDGTNLEAIRNFIAGAEVDIDQDGTRARIKWNALPDTTTELILEVGDGLVRDGRFVIGMRNLVFAEDLPKPGDTIH